MPGSTDRSGRHGRTMSRGGSGGVGGTSTPSSVYAVLQRFWQRSYAGDYLGLTLLLVAFLLVQFLGQPFHSQFRLNDPRIQHPHATNERVPVVWLSVYAVLLPAAALLAWTFVLQPPAHKTHVTFLGFFISVVMACFLTDLFKDAIGRPRPDLIARCLPDGTAPPNKLVTVDVCTQTNQHVLHDGWRSFPSGHSSLAFSGLGWLSLFLASQNHVLRPRASLVVVLVCLVPLLGAALIAISRLEDYRHDVFDVVCGSLLGFAVALFHWRRYFPSLLAKTCDEPYPPPYNVSGSSPTGTYRRARDEEEGDIQGLDPLETEDEGHRYGPANGDR